MYPCSRFFRATLAESETLPDEIKPASVDMQIDVFLKCYPAIGLIAFGLPGPEYGHVMIKSDHCFSNRMQFSKYYREKNKLPVVLVNNVNLALLGFCHEKHADEDMVYLNVCQ